MIAALEIDLNVDLSEFSVFLRQARIEHRIAEEGDMQVVWVTDEPAVVQVRELYLAFRAGALPRVSLPPAPGFRLSVDPLRIPLTLVIIAISVLCFPVTFSLTDGQISEWYQQMSFLDFTLAGDRVYFLSLEETLAKGEYWRLLTPMFLHFGWLHLVFNLLWVWEVGRRIELINGAGILLLITLVSSLLANLTQHYLSGPSFFGGMSGVVFGYLGYSLIWSRLVPGRHTGLAPGIYIFMFIYLAVGFTGAIDLLGLGSLANGAHLGGLIGGLLTGFVAGLIFREPSEE